MAGGIVLCGGRSTRMGTPKAWLPVGGETFLGRTVRVVGEVCSPVVVVAAVGQELPPLPPGVEVVRDAAPDNGPLQGLLAGLEALAGHRLAAHPATATSSLPHKGGGNPESVAYQCARSRSWPPATYRG